MGKLFKRGIHAIIGGLGYELRKIRESKFPDQLDVTFKVDTVGLKKIQYGCGIKLLKDWVNVDSLPLELLESWRKDQIPEAERLDIEGFFYRSLDLTSRQPFADNYFEFAFTEDFIEHLSQAQSIVFLSECYRVLQPGGVLRMSFPGLEGILKNHYFKPTGFQSANEAKADCYDQWEHIHFYSREELSLVALHLGYSGVSFPEYGQSQYTSLTGLDTRSDQKNVNTYVELSK